METKSSRRHQASLEREAECGCSPGQTAGSPRLRHSVTSHKYFTEFTLHPAFHRWNKEPQGLSGSENVRQSMSLLCRKLPGASHLPWGKRLSPYKGLQSPTDLTSYALGPPPFLPSFPRTLQAVSFLRVGTLLPLAPTPQGPTRLPRHLHQVFAQMPPACLFYSAYLELRHLPTPVSPPQHLPPSNRITIFKCTLLS